MNSWAIEVRDKSGDLFFGRQVFAISSVVKTVAEVMTFDKTGGIVIYRSTVAESNECETDEECLAYKTLGITPHVCLLRPGHEGDHQWTADTENLEMVASGNDVVVVGAPPIYIEPGSCKTCGCPTKNMPMINRGTGWCCEAHRKEQL